MRGTLQERFWAKVHKTNTCWKWTAAKTEGYGVLGGPSRILAHRLSWIIHHGRIPKNLLVLHHCDNPSCVNPDHLFLGTAGDNLHDAMKKGRWSPCHGNDLSGSANPNTHLTLEQVIAIRSEWIPRKVSKRILSEKYGVSLNTIDNIVRKQTWRKEG